MRFKIGYTLNKECDSSFWDNLELFIAYRTAITYMSLCDIDEIGVVSDTEKVKQFFAFLIGQDDIMDAMSLAMKDGGSMI